MHEKRSGLQAWEEILPDENQESERGECSRKVARTEEARVRSQPVQQAAVGIAETLKPDLETGMKAREDAAGRRVLLAVQGCHLANQYEVGHCRCQRA